MLVQDFLERNAKARPDKTALVSGSRRFTYGELEAMANRLANGLREHGIERGDRVAVYLNNSVETVLVHRAVEAAVAVFNKGVRAFPQSERMLAGLGAALYANGAYDAAATQLCDAVDLNPSDRRSYLFLGKMEQAAPRGLPCAEEKLALFAHRNPDDAQANFYYAIALQQSGKEQDKKHVASLLQNAVKLDPEFAEAYLQLGIVQSQSGDWVGARASYEKAAVIRPSLPDPHFRLAQIYKHTGDDLRASQELQTFERLKQSDAVAVEERRREIRQFVIVPNASSDSSPH